MKIRMFLFPGYVSIDSAVGFGPNIFHLLASHGVELETCWWDGTIEELPTDGPAIIRASTRMDCSWVDLAKRCAELGHLLFYNDHSINSEGTLVQETLLDEVEEFLASFALEGPRAKSSSSSA